jgi:sigma-B regulation protein RsbU (phosphoserine phosphatase)
MARELALAGQVQATFLPDTLPAIPGWQWAVTLQPARQTSGDFYDVFYAILDPASGELIYGNAGHCPPLLFGRGQPPRWLANTGMPLGILAEATWEQRMVHIAPGAALIVYTDGLIEAEDGAERPFGQERLFDAAKAHLGGTAVSVQQGIVAAVREFVGERPLLDDLALMVIVRE